MVVPRSSHRVGESVNEPQHQRWRDGPAPAYPRKQCHQDDHASYIAKEGASASIHRRRERNSAADQVHGDELRRYERRNDDQHDNALERTLRRLDEDDPSLTDIDWRLGRRKGGHVESRRPWRKDGRDGAPLRPEFPVGPRGTARLASALLSNSTLCKLRIDGHAIGDAGAASFLILSIALCSDDETKSSGSGFGDSDGKTGRQQPEARVVERQWCHFSLSEICLRDNGIGPRGGDALSMLLIDKDAAESCKNCGRGARGSQGNGGCRGSRDGSGASSNSRDPSAPCVTSAEISARSSSTSKSSATAVAKVTTPVLPNLVRLDLSHNPLGPMGVRSIARSLLHNSSLSVLVISSTRAGDEGANHLAHLLRNTTTLTTLRLRDNDITGMGACAIMHALWDNVSLVELDLSDNQDVGESGGVAAGDMIGQNTTLTWLRMGRCGLGDLAAVAIARGLEAGSGMMDQDDGSGGTNESGKSALPSDSSRSFSPLAVLDLSRNLLTPNGMDEICASMRLAPTSLHRLDLSGNWDMGDEGAYTAADMLRTAPSCTFSLRELSLRGCGIGEDGVVALGQAAMHCARLEVLELGENDFDEEVAQELRKMLMGQHGTLKKLDLSK